MTDNKVRAREFADVVFNKHDLDRGVDYFTQVRIPANSITRTGVFEQSKS